MIKELLTENTNIIEFYLIQKPIINKNNIDISITDDLISKIKNNFKKTKETKYAYYNRNNYTYVYDLSNDSQYVYIRKLENMNIINNNKFYLLLFNEIKLPTHNYSCTNDIDNKSIIDIIEFKINNRITIIIKNNNCLINYKHNKDVDIDKIEDIIKNLLIKIASF
jgi:hypothetical protein